MFRSLNENEYTNYRVSAKKSNSSVELKNEIPIDQTICEEVVENFIERIRFCSIDLDSLLPHIIFHV